jgi:hypothetical protein
MPSFKFSGFSYGAMAIFKPTHFLYADATENIKKLTIDGATESTLLTSAQASTSGFIYGIAYDHIGGWIYWVDNDDNLKRIRPNGEDYELIAAMTIGGRPQELVFSAYDQCLYLLSTFNTADAVVQIKVSPAQDRGASTFSETVLLDLSSGGDVSEITFSNALGTADNDGAAGISTNGRFIYIVSDGTGVGASPFLLRFDREDITNYTYVAATSGIRPAKCVYDPLSGRLIYSTTEQDTYSRRSNLSAASEAKLFDNIYTGEAKWMRLDPTTRTVYVYYRSSRISSFSLNNEEDEAIVETLLTSTASTPDRERGTLIRLV